MQNDSMFYSPSSENEIPAMNGSFTNEVFKTDGSDNQNDLPKENSNSHLKLEEKRSSPPMNAPPVFIPMTPSESSFNSQQDDQHNIAHNRLEEKISSPPTNAPPVFIPMSEPLFKDDNPKAENGSSDDEDNDGNEYITNEDGDSKTGAPRGILRYRASVRDPNAAEKKVTFGALPRRHGDTNPCIVLVLVVLLIVSIVAFLLILMVIKGSIKTTCSCKDDIRKAQTAFQESALHCPVGWSVGKQSCYGSASQSKQTYSDARLLCAEHGAYILSLETKEESDWFTRNILQLRRQYDTTVSSIFLGIKPRSDKKNYYWESNNIFYDWQRNLPEAGNGTCFVVSNNDQWMTVNCTVAHPFYCEKPKYN